MTKNETQAVAVRQETGLALLPPRQAGEDTRHYLFRLMEMLPPADSDVLERMGEAIFSAPTLQAQNALWDATGSKDAIGRRLIFDSVHLMPSDYEDSWTPWYLVCKVTDVETGEAGMLTTGSENIMKQLVAAQVRGELPWEAEIVGPKKPTRLGRLPLHLRWIAKVVEGPRG